MAVFDKLVAFQDWVLDQIASAISGGRVTPTGSVIPFAGSSAPTGFLLCQGQDVSRTTYADLFAVIGTTYGPGDGSTTFNVPDIGGRVVAGREASATRLTTGGSGIDGDTLGAAGGSQTHSLIAAELASHGHSVDDHMHAGVAGSNFALANAGTAYGTTVAGGNYIGYTPTTGGVTAALNTGLSGSGAAHQNTQPTIVLNYIIAA